MRTVAALAALMVAVCWGTATAADENYGAILPLSAGDVTHCQVTGKRLVVSSRTPRLKFDGLWYYFINTDAENKFEQDPYRYLPKIDDELDLAVPLN